MKLYDGPACPFRGCCFVLQLIPIRINLLFVRENKDDFFTVRISTLFSLLRLSFDVPVIRRKSSAEVYLEAEMKAGDSFAKKAGKCYPFLPSNYRQCAVFCFSCKKIKNTFLLA